MTWAGQIDALCKRIGSQAEAARTIGYTESAVCRWIKGDREPPNDTRKQRILRDLREKAEKTE